MGIEEVPDGVYFDSSGFAGGDCLLLGSQKLAEDCVGVTGNECLNREQHLFAEGLRVGLQLAAEGVRGCHVSEGQRFGFEVLLDYWILEQRKSRLSLDKELGDSRGLYALLNLILKFGFDNHNSSLHICQVIITNCKC